MHALIDGSWHGTCNSLYDAVVSTFSPYLSGLGHVSMVLDRSVMNAVDLLPTAGHTRGQFFWERLTQHGMEKSMQQPVFIQNPNGYGELVQFFETAVVPYSVHDISAFNAIYRCIYPTLSRQERLLAETLVDQMIERLEHPLAAAKIYGVV